MRIFGQLLTETDVDYYDNDLGIASVPSLVDCINTCDQTANCTTVVFVSPTACYLKYAQGATVPKGADFDYSAASLVSNGSVSSASSSTSKPQTTITTTNPPITSIMPMATTTISSSQSSTTYPSCWTYCWSSYGVDSRSQACSSDQATQCIKQECSASDYNAYQAWLQNGCPQSTTSPVSSTCPAPSTVTSIFTQSAPPASTITKFTTSQVNVTATETITAPCTTSSVPVATLTETEYITATASKRPTQTVTVTISPSEAMPPPPSPDPTHPRSPPPGPEPSHPQHDNAFKSCPKPNLDHCEPARSYPWAWQIQNQKHSYSASTTCGVIPTGPWLETSQENFDRAGGFGECIDLGGQDPNAAAVAWDPNARKCKAYGVAGMRDQEGGDWMQYAELVHWD